MISKAQGETKRNRIRILVIDDHVTVRQELIKLLEQKLDLVLCAEAENADQALEVMARQQVDLAIVDISQEVGAGSKLAEKIKSNRPYLAMVLLSIEDEPIYSGHTLRPEAERSSSDQKVTEQIIKTLVYAQSLLRSRILGFTLAAKIERTARTAC
jgi:DNA-binding NarL/FixJ family response regulator